MLRAEEWGDEVFQPIARRLLWPALRRRPASMPSYAEGSRIALPAVAVRAMAPVATRVEVKLNSADEGAVRADLRSLPDHLDRIDGWIAEGVIGGAAPNRADLQIAPTAAPADDDRRRAPAHRRAPRRRAGAAPLPRPRGRGAGRRLPARVAARAAPAPARLDAAGAAA